MPITELQLDAAVRALATVLPMRGPADSALSYFFREHKNLGPKDRAFIAEAVSKQLPKIPVRVTCCWPGW
jgi:16S rRNA (cytosine967-C5)-methyltransferase